MSSIELLGSTDNVVDFLVSALEKLSTKALQIINLGACFGNSFDLRLVTGLTSIGLYDAEQCLWNPLRAGMSSVSPVLKARIY